MKIAPIVLVSLLATGIVFAQGALGQQIPAPTGTAVPPATGVATISDAGCGPENETFEVKSENSKHPVSQPPAWMALVYFIQDDTDYRQRPRPTTRWGLDGSWLGATQSNAYFYMSIKPGPHQLCVRWQNAAIMTDGRKSSALAWEAKAGESYYFMAQDFYWEQPLTTAVRLGQVIPQESQLRMSKFAYCTFTPKKK